ncbi:response regulator [Lacinutrix sp. Hel_I_90]|uniref:response regulator n=1 Tax=Lacinutrix sp. Hel_I_90 TaxID=1249999 RepID=UPI0005C96C49|nr:response regulator [Lacinutrix sp. Hel_I_90]
MKKSNILLVDDDKVYLFIMNKIISALSSELEVSSFTDGEQAVKFLERCTEEDIKLPEVIFLDINMPFLDGWGFLAEFKKLKSKIHKKINIYMVSSSSREEDVQRAAQFKELTGYVVKPIEEDKLVEIFTKIYADNW